MNIIKDMSISDTNHSTQCEYLIKRWNKVSAGFYFVSAHIKDSDQIKWNIRNRPLDIMSFMYEIQSVYNGQRQTVIDSCLKEINVLSSELYLAHISGLINHTNHKILSEEVASFVKELVEFRDKDAVLSPLQKEFMQVEVPVVESIGHHIGHILPKQTAPEKKNREPVKDMSQDVARQQRRLIIVDLLKKTDKLALKDFTLSIKNCSEKTIQRELMFLVEQGVLYKTGDRRWSTYSLIKK